MRINIDKILNYSIALVIPKIVFILLKITASSKGGGAITSRLKDISFNIGVEEGVGVYVIMALVLYSLSEHYSEKYFANKIELERLENKILTGDILKQIDSYLVSKSLKKKLKAAYILQTYY